MAMKRTCKTVAAAILAALAFAVCAQGGVPLEWAATPGRPAPAQFDRFHGEALELRCEFRGFDPLPFEAGGDVRLWWQTNGMGNAWWSIAATVSSNALSATWGPRQDPGAERVSMFFGAPSNAYAAASLRLRGSPGGTPNELEPPSVVDWAGATNAIYDAIAAVDAAWREGTNGLASVEYVEGAIAAAGGVTPEMVTNAAGAAATNAVTNIVTKSYVEKLGIAADVSLAPATNYTDSAIGEAVRTNYLCTVAAAAAMTNAAMDEVRRGFLPADSAGVLKVNTSFSWDATQSFYMIEVADWDSIELGGVQTLPSYLADREDAFEAAKVAPVAAGLAVVSNREATTSAKVDAWETYWDGDEVRMTVTNYDSAVHMPSAYLEQKDDVSHDYKVVWSEMTRWTWFLGEYGLATNDLWEALGGKADRAWGFTDSHTGSWAPDGYTWISSPRIAIAAGLAYQRTITSGGAVWVLESNGLVTESGGTVSNGFFRISDDEGTALFEAVRGSRSTLGATAGATETEKIMGVTHLYVHYAVESSDHPVLRVCRDLAAADWQSESSSDCAANVSWTGSSGAWVAEVWGKSAETALFVKAEYETGGETYIRNAAPLSAEGGIYCTDGVHKVRPVYNGPGAAITWEVVP